MVRRSWIDFDLVVRNAAVALLALFFARTTTAQTPEALSLTSRGIALRREHRNEEALEAFRQAYALDPTPRARAQIGLAEHALGRWLDAEVDLKAAQEASDDPWIAANHASLVLSLNMVADHLGWVEIRTNVERVETWVNGARVLSGSKAIRVEAGSVMIDLRAAGFVSEKRAISVGGRALVREDVQMDSVRERPPAPVEGPSVAAVTHDAPAPSAGKRGSWVTPAALASLAVGASGVVVGTYLGLRTLGLKSQRDEHCDGTGCDPRGLELDGDARRAALASSLGWGVGLLGSGMAIFLFSLADSTPATLSPTKVHVVPAVGPRSASISLTAPW